MLKFAPALACFAINASETQSPSDSDSRDYHRAIFEPDTKLIVRFIRSDDAQRPMLGHVGSIVTLEFLGMVAGYALMSWQRVLLLLLAVFGFAQIGYWAVVAEGFEKPLDPICASWDREASVGVALLVPNATALAESHLDDALFRLRRARKNCRAGWLDIARQDYLSLRDDHPFPGRPMAEASGGKAKQ